MSLEKGVTIWINIAMIKIFNVTTPFIQQGFWVGGGGGGRYKSMYLFFKK